MDFILGTIADRTHPRQVSEPSPYGTPLRSLAASDPLFHPLKFYRPGLLARPQASFDDLLGLSGFRDFPQFEGVAAAEDD
jgi:hypothetical protein